MINESFSWVIESKKNEDLALQLAAGINQQLPFSPDFYDLITTPIPRGVRIKLVTDDGDELGYEILTHTSTAETYLVIYRIRSTVKGRGSLLIRTIHDISREIAHCQFSRASTVLPNSRHFWKKMGYHPENGDVRDREWVLTFS